MSELFLASLLSSMIRIYGTTRRIFRIVLRYDGALVVYLPLSTTPSSSGYFIQTRKFQSMRLLIVRHCNHCMDIGEVLSGRIPHRITVLGSAASSSSYLQISGDCLFRLMIPMSNGSLTILKLIPSLAPLFLGCARTPSTSPNS
jgi:hypothetical protein